MQTSTIDTIMTLGKLPNTHFPLLGTYTQTDLGQDSLVKALLIGIKVFWWGKLLIRLEWHVSVMLLLFRPALGHIDQSLAILRVHPQLAITIKMHHRLRLDPSGPAHSEASSVGGMLGDQNWAAANFQKHRGMNTPEMATHTSQSNGNLQIQSPDLCS